MNENAYIVYYINQDGYQYCVNSGEMNFSSNINRAYQYTKDEAVSIANYFGRTNKCKGCEVGYLTVVRTVTDKTITKTGE